MTMQKKAIFFIVMLGICSLVNAQCDKKLKVKTEKVYQVNADNTEGDEIPVTAVITLSKDSIFVLMNWTDGNVADLKGRHTQTVCKMNKSYSEGTVEYKTDATLTTHGEAKASKMLFTIESKAGRIKLYGVPEDDKDKICFVIKEKEEIK